MDFHPIKLSPVSARGKTTVERAGWRVAATFSTAEAETAAAQRSVGLADLSAWGKIQIQGAEALAALRSAFGNAPADIGAVTALAGGLLACLSRDAWYLTVPPGGEAAALDQLRGKLQGFAHAVDVTHGYAAFLLAGPNSLDVLPKVCGLDFRSRAFPNRTVRQSSVARLRTIIIRDDLPGGVPAFHLHLGRSEAEYLWDTLLDAASEFGGQPVGATALDGLLANAR
jgi:heterotetrameric sarcosine oxidase gamma subunit